MGRWIFVRHAQSTANAGRFLSAHLDVPLTAEGVDQARALAPLLAAERIQRVVSSDLQRAVHTAQLAAGGRSWAVRTTPALRERDMGIWTGLKLERLREVGAGAVFDSFTAKPPGGDSLKTTALAAVRWLDGVDDGRVNLVVAHGGLLRALIGLIDGTAPEVFVRQHVPNAVPVVRTFPLGTWSRIAAELEA